MADKNYYSFMGRLTADTKLNYTKLDEAVLNFNVVTNRYHKHRETGERIKTALFLKCTAWRKKAELIDQFFKKGSNIAIDGHLENENWEDAQGNKRTGIVVIVDEFYFMDRADPTEQHQEANENRVNDDNRGNQEVDTDDAIPF